MFWQFLAIITTTAVIFIALFVPLTLLVG